MRELENRIYDRHKESKQPLNHVIEYDAIIRTEKVHE